jgi:CO/xanthine dehydrogenase FAD-binding subunit
MYAAAFDYLRASSWPDAVAILQREGEDAHVIAGGQSLVPMMMLRLAAPSALVDLAGAGERTMEADAGRLALSALVRHVDLEQSDLVRRSCPMLAEAVGHIGNARVRQRGTIGGSLAHAEATAELSCVAVALGAQVHVLGPAGQRTIAADDLFVSHLTTSLAPAEVITAIEFPVLEPSQGTCFVEIARRAGDFAMVEAAAVITLDEEGGCAGVRLVVGAVGDRPADVSEATAELLHQPPSAAAIDRVARGVAEQVEVGPSSHAAVEYRRELVAVLCARALRQAAARAGGDDANGGGA